MALVFVTGATGLVGAHAVAELLRRGHQVRALVRSREKLEQVLAPFDIEWNHLEAIEGDIGDPSGLNDAMRGCDAALHAAGVFSDRLEDQPLLDRINVRGTEGVLQSACDLGIDPVVYVSSIVALFPPPGDRQTVDDPVQTPDSMYARSKADAERVARRFQDDGSPVVTVYPGAIHGPHDPTFSIGPQMIVQYVEKGAVLVTESGLAYTDVRDLARVIACAVERKGDLKRYMLGGHFLSHAQLHALLSELTGRRLKAQRIPGPLLRLLGRLNDALSRVFPLRPQLTYEAASILTRSVPCDDAATLDACGITLIPAQDSFRDLLLWAYDTGRLSKNAAGSLAGDR